MKNNQPKRKEVERSLNDLTIPYAFEKRHLLRLFYAKLGPKKVRSTFERTFSIEVTRSANILLSKCDTNLFTDKTA